jgi:DNA-binding CsgD family transcriptional regulator
MALGQLRAITQLNDLLREGARKLRQSTGASLVALYRVDGAALSLESVSTEADIVDLPHSPQCPQPGSLAAEAIRREEPLSGPIERSGCHPAARDGASTCVCLPVHSTTGVVALLYMTRTSECGPDELDVIALAAQGLAYAIERVVLLGRLEAQRRHFRRLMITGDAIMSELSEAPLALPDRRDVTGDEADLWMAAPVRPTSIGAPPLAGLNLTAREHEIMSLLAHGTRNREIAARLVISECTVKSHVHRIFRKLNVSNRAEAVNLYATAAAGGMADSGLPAGSNVRIMNPPGDAARSSAAHP